MKELSIWIVSLLVCSGFAQVKEEVYPPIKQSSFTRGEVIQFKMNFGIFTIGKGTAQIHPKYFKVNDRDCFKVDITGRTVGMVDWVANVNNRYGAYIDTTSILPLQFYRSQREGNYKKDEWTDFDQVNRKIEVKEVDDKTGKLKAPKVYDAPANVRDMVGGFLLLRTMDLSKAKIGDTISVKGFFEDSFYNLKILYRGKETIKTKIGRVRSLVFVPVMPDNKLFDGENSITAWFSDDKNRIPVKISAEMFIGSAGVEITGYSGLKNPLNLEK